MSDIYIPGIINKQKATLANTKEPTPQEAYDMCCAFTLALTTLYPGHLWEAGMLGNMVYIKAPNLNAAMGYKVHINEIDVEGKTLMRIGGEILERFGQRRGSCVVSHVRSLKRDIRGNASPLT